MSRSEKGEKCCSKNANPIDFKVESIVSIDDRGQMVLPKDIREKFGLRSGDKLALLTKEQNGKVCCIYLFKTEELMSSAKERLGPLLSEAQQS